MSHSGRNCAAPSLARAGGHSHTARIRGDSLTNGPTGLPPELPPELPTELPTGPTLDRVEAHLRPVLGTLLAAAAIRAQRDRLGVGATVTRDQLAALVDALAKGTRVFAGARRTDEVFAGLLDRVLAEAGE